MSLLQVSYNNYLVPALVSHDVMMICAYIAPKHSHNYTYMAVYVYHLCICVCGGVCKAYMTTWYTFFPKIITLLDVFTVFT